MSAHVSNQMLYQVTWERSSRLLVMTVYQSSNPQSNSHVSGVLTMGHAQERQGGAVVRDTLWSWTILASPGTS